MVDHHTGDDRTERLARKLIEGGDEDSGAFADKDEARRGATARLEDSDARAADPAVTDPDDPGVIRRTSDEAVSDTDPNPHE
ncbi:MAG: hypothetical protein H0U16_11795 [Actinobacteria bacterium]|nr:hypothetical protein [Actinomycetota bacterium]